MKNIVSYILVVVSLVFLVGCESKENTKIDNTPKELTKIYKKEYGEHLSAQSKLYYKENSDLLDKQEITITYKNISDAKKKELKDEFNSRESIEGIERKLEETEKGITTVVTSEYSKIDLEKVVSNKEKLEQIISDDRKSLSLSKVEKDLKDGGFEEKTENK